MADGELDWGDGDYGRTAAVLMPAAETLVAAAGVAAGEDVLDLACGTGNASFAAARLGARVTGVDAATALVSLAARRVPEATFLVGDLEALPARDAAFDVALSAFGLIFARDAERAVAEAMRCLRPAGRLALTTWDPTGPIAAAGGILAAAVLPAAPNPPRWGDPDSLEELLARHGARDVSIADGHLAFTAASPLGWFEEQERHHPVWRWARRRLDEERWAEIRDRSVTLLAAANEATTGFRTTSRYLVAVSTRT